jgi:EAL domain-containing protein (putative c-di-GMP-specific phosphodiesterase class I)
VQEALRLRRLVGAEDLVARIGGNEYVIAVADEPRPHLSDAVLAAVQEPVQVGGRRVVPSASIGIADSAVSPSTSGADLLREADIALYRAKEQGAGTAATYDQALHQRVVERFAIEADLRVALEQGGLHLAFQPVFDATSGRVAACEALSRWEHPTRGTIPPGKFIPVAEATGLIIPLGEWVLRTVGRLLRSSTKIIGDRPFVTWVNVSGRQLLDPSFFPLLEEQIEGVEDRIGLEVTESVLLDDPTAAAMQLQRLADVGVQIAIDDFGTGYSSLARLTHYPLHVIKIDQSFVAQIEGRQHRAIVVAIIELAHAFGARTVAEGVETPEQLRILREIGCDEVSGYLLARPSPLEELRANIVAGKSHLHHERLPLEWPLGRRPAGPDARA